MIRRLQEMPLLWIAGVLFSFVLVASALVGNKGYWGDDWAVISAPFWWGIPRAIEVGAENIRRTTAAIYFAFALKLARFDVQATFFMSFSIYTVSSILMGLAVQVAFPKRFPLVYGVTLMSFFLPMLTPLNYFLILDTSRLAVLFYWVSVLLFQHWATRPQAWSLPFLPIIAFALAILGYEANFMMPPITLLMIYPVYQRYHPNTTKSKTALMIGELVIAHVISMAIYFFVRHIYDIGVHVSREGNQPLTDFIRYLTIFPPYFSEPFRWFSIHPDPLAWLVGAIMAVWCAGIGWYLIKQHHHQPSPFKESAYLLTVATLAIVLGLLPFAIYRIKTDVTGVSVDGRIYCVSAFGFALWISWLLNRINPRFMTVMVAIWAGIMSAYVLTLRHEWHDASILRDNLHRSLLEQVPNLQDDTVILYLNYPFFTENNAAVIEHQVAHYHTKLMYQNELVSGAPLTTRSTNGFDPIVSDDLLSVPGKTVPVENVVILQRVGDQFEVVDSLHQSEGYALEWTGNRTSLSTNRERIQTTPQTDNRFLRLMGLAE
jgi:hypothetical protein